MPKKTLPRHRKDYVWAHPYGHGPFSPVLYADGGAGDGGGSGSSSSGTGADGGQGAGGDGGQGGAGAGSAGAGSGQDGGGDTTDWKAEARKWEQRAKDNKTAADDLAALKASQMSDQEKAVADAEKKGRTSAAADYGLKLAGAEFRAAVAAAHIDLGEAAELIDVARFVADDGEVNVAAIKSAVTKLSKLAPAGGPGRSGGDFGGGSGDQAASLDKQIEDATTKRDFATVIRLKRQKAAQTT